MITIYAEYDADVHAIGRAQQRAKMAGEDLFPGVAYQVVMVRPGEMPSHGAQYGPGDASAPRPGHPAASGQDGNAAAGSAPPRVVSAGMTPLGRAFTVSCEEHGLMGYDEVRRGYECAACPAWLPDAEAHRLADGAPAGGPDPLPVIVI